HADALERRDPLAEARARRIAKAPRSFALAHVEGADALCRESQIAAARPRQVRERRREIVGRDTEASRTEPHPVEPECPVKQSPIAPAPDVGHDAPHAGFDGTARLLAARLEPREPSCRTRGSRATEHAIEFAHTAAF